MTAAHIAILAGYFVLALALLNWSRSGIVRALAGAFFLTAIGATAYAAVDGMGRARPQALDFQTPPGCYAVRGYDFAEGKALYVWLAVGEAADPMLLALPWDIRTAQSLIEAAQQAAQNGQPMMMATKGARCGEGGGAEGSMAPKASEGRQQTVEGDAAGYDAGVFYAPPPAELPPKT